MLNSIKKDSDEFVSPTVSQDVAVPGDPDQYDIEAPRKKVDIAATFTNDLGVIHKT